MRARLGDDLTVTDLFCGAGGSSIGAVTPPAMSLLVERVIEALA